MIGGCPCETLKLCGRTDEFYQRLVLRGGALSKVLRGAFQITCDKSRAADIVPSLALLYRGCPLVGRVGVGQKLLFRSLTDKEASDPLQPILGAETGVSVFAGAHANA